ncbi:MAG: hypothetical protein NZ824_05685 [Candidatus Thioglobus sp.]|nr:hypothetical protein [Candidatus Thioglobus sp.]|tara:strand:- start:311 stop:796 length:486 start_codon:yes stop_codon:yes gene_type:complete
MRKKKFEGYNNFASVPRYVIDTPAFKSLRGNSVKLLVLLASQYKGKNNGDLIITHSKYKSDFKSSQTMYAARDELEEKGFIATNAYGGMSYGGCKQPSLYALTWLPVDDFLDLTKNQFRCTHLAIDKEPLKYFIQGVNPKYKNTKQKKKQYKKDLKTSNVK